MINLDSVLKSRDIPFLTKISSQSYGVFSSNVWMWELDYKESWGPKNRCFWTMVLEKTLESPLDSKEIKPVNPKENQPWIFIVRTDDEAEAPILWLPDVKSQLIGKDPDAGKEWRQEEKGATGNEMVVWGCKIVWCILTSRYLVSLLLVSIIHVSDIFLVGFWSWEISFIMRGCRGWGWQVAGTWVLVSVKS